VPEVLKPKAELPDLDEVEQNILHHYLNARTDRPVSGMGGMYPLQWSKLSEYALKNGFTGSEHDWFINVMFRIDRDQVEYVTEKQQKRSKGRHKK
jgi:hypothetical protein